MRCPQCHGIDVRELNDGLWQCQGQVIVNAVPPGLGGNAGAVPIPIYGRCGATFSLEDEQRAQRHRETQSARRDSEAKLWFERDQLNKDPETRKRIAELAQKLINARSEDTVGVIVDVKVPRTLPFLKAKHGRAEVYRAWPIGKSSKGEPAIREGMAITRDGKLVSVSHKSPSVQFSPSLQWVDPARSDFRGNITGQIFFDDFDRFPYALVLQRLEREWRATVHQSDSEKPAEAPSLPVRGKALSERDIRKLGRLYDKLGALKRANDRQLDFYGTPDNPRERGRPSRAARKSFAQQRRNEAEMQRLQNEIDRIEGLI
ncbi:hypothetical protein FXF50_04770 [Micromonospora sp. AP08]|uniref:hypothetical protein n=1 Tax=Micromonospora sp. AP08 TaxID=2604467 RepID=UPI0011D48BA8|nr:hypothetical protein [Micromonospora sp. AP08]TYB39695.1 hypothetical protein FXF50_04770 [Micromonospora sp. AP08]